MEWRWGHFSVVTKLNVLFEGIFLIIEDHGVGSGVAESCCVWDECMKLCTDSSSDFVFFFVYMHFIL